VLLLRLRKLCAAAREVAPRTEAIPRFKSIRLGAVQYLDVDLDGLHGLALSLSQALHAAGREPAR
jgi:hypothetical protein